MPDGCVCLWSVDGGCGLSSGPGGHLRRQLPEFSLRSIKTSAVCVVLVHTDATGALLMCQLVLTNRFFVK